MKKFMGFTINDYVVITFNDNSKIRGVIASVRRFDIEVIQLVVEEQKEELEVKYKRFYIPKKNIKEINNFESYFDGRLATYNYFKEDTI